MPLIRNPKEGRILLATNRLLRRSIIHESNAETFLQIRYST